MEYFKKCPECGRYMISEIVSSGHVRWTCICGNVLHTGYTDIAYVNKTIYTGGGASDRQVTERLSDKNPCNSCKVDRQIGNPNRWECECSRCDKPNDWKNGCIKKLAEYETAEEDGRLVVLPCDTVYFICDKGTKDAHVRTKSILDLLVYDINGIDKDGRYWSVKEEAEKALKEMKKNERILY